VLRRNKNTKIECFPLISFAYIFMEKTESHLRRYEKSINVQGAKIHRERFFSTLHGMPARTNDEKAARPSVRPSVCQTRAL